MKCLDCKFFDGSVSGKEEKPDGSWLPIFGMCRRNPPALFEMDQEGHWPLVNLDDWCGAFEPAGKPLEVRITRVPEGGDS